MIRDLKRVVHSELPRVPVAAGFFREKGRFEKKRIRAAPWRWPNKRRPKPIPPTDGMSAIVHDHEEKKQSDGRGKRAQLAGVYDQRKKEQKYVKPTKLK